MSLHHKWHYITDGATFESLVQAIVYFKDSNAKLFSRPGRDAAIDILSGDESTVFQVKFRKHNSIEEAIKLALNELSRITEYKTSASRYEYKAWEKVKNWVLVTNIEIGPNDKIKWQDAVAAKFASIGLVTNLWTLKNLDDELLQYTDIALAYFEGKNRVFLSIPEAYSFLQSEAFSSAAYNSAIFGREEELERINEFINSDKIILAICGYGGVGKTRLLYEIGVKYSQEEWQVFWAQTDSLTESNSWFNAVNFNRKTILLIDEPRQIDLIFKLKEQLRLTEWKAIIALRSYKAPIVKELTSSRTRIWAPILFLNPISTTSAIEYSEWLITNTDDINIADIHAASAQLVKQFDSYPALILLAIEAIKKGKSLNSFQEVIDSFSELYLEEILGNISPSECNKNYLINLLRWISLYGVLNIEDSSSIDFFCSLDASLPKGLFDKILQELKRYKIVKNWGVNKRLYKVIPEILQDYILSDWLLIEDDGQYKVSGEGKFLIDNILLKQEKGTVPCIDEIFETLARTELLYRGESRNIPIVEPILDEFINVFENKPAASLQKRIIELTSKINICSPRKALEIYKLVRTNITEDEEIDCGMWGKYIMTHESVVDEIAWEIYCLARYVDEGDRKLVIEELIALLKTEWEQGKESRSGKSAQELLPRLISRSQFSHLYTEVIRARTMSLLSHLKSESPIADFDNFLLKVLASNLLKVERMYTKSTDDMSVTYTSYVISFDSQEWETCSSIRACLKDIITDRTFHPQNHFVSWDLLQESHHEISRTSASVKDSKCLNELCKIIINDMAWTLHILSSHSLPLKEMQTARGVWKWYCQFGEDGSNEKDIAEQCENIYLANKDASIFEGLVDWDKHSEHADMGKIIATNLIENDDIDDIYSFVENFHDFVSGTEHDFGKSNHVALPLAEQFENKGCVSLYVADALKKDDKSCEYKFATYILEFYLNILRANEDSDKIYDVVKPYLSDDAATIKLLYDLYCWLARNTKISPDDFRLVKEYYPLFIQAHEFSKVFIIIGAVSYASWDEALVMLNKCWNAVEEDIKARTEAIKVYISSLYSSSLSFSRHGYQLDDNIIDFIFDKIRFTLDIEDCLPRELEKLVQSSEKRNLEWLYELLRTRIELGKSVNRDEYPEFRIIPFSFNANKWIMLGEDVDKIHLHLEKIIDLAREHSSVSFFLPEFISSVDAENKYIPDIVARKLNSLKNESDVNNILIWSRFAGCYSNDSPYWRTIASPACKLASTLSSKGEMRIYHSLNRIHTGIRNVPLDRVDPYWEDQVKRAELLLETETDNNILGYRREELKQARYNLQDAIERFEEESQ